MVDKGQLDSLVGSLGGSPDDKARKIGQLSERVGSLDVELKTRWHPPSTAQSCIAHIHLWMLILYPSFGGVDAVFLCWRM